MWASWACGSCGGCPWNDERGDSNKKLCLCFGGNVLDGRKGGRWDGDVVVSSPGGQRCHESTALSQADCFDDRRGSRAEPVQESRRLPHALDGGVGVTPAPVVVVWWGATAGADHCPAASHWAHG